MKIFMISSCFIVLGLLVYKNFNVPSEQQPSVEKAAYSLNEYAKQPALNPVVYHQQDHQFDAGSMPSHQQQSPEELRAAIEKIETDLDAANVVQRLNNNTVGDEERRTIGSQFEALNRLREQAIVQELADIEHVIVALELNHERRLRDYRVVQP